MVKEQLSCAFTEHHAIKLYWGSGSTAPCVFDLGTRWRASGQIHAPAPYPQGKSPWHSLDRTLGGHCGEEKNFQPLTGLEPPIIHPVAQNHTTELSRPLYKDRY
jgi:hypothetical protein